MQALSHKEYGELRSLYESIYISKEELTEEILDEVFNELVDELIEEGYEEEEAIEIVDEASDSYYDSAVRASKKAAQGLDKAARQKRRAGQVRYAKRKAGEALRGAVSAVKGAASDAYKTAKAKAASAATDVSLAGSMAKKKASEVKQAVKDAPGKAKAAVDRKKEETKKGIKGFIKRQAQKVVNRMSEEIEALEASGLFTEQELGAIMEAEVQELYKGKHGQSDKEYAASRSQGGKMISGDDKMSGAEYTHGRRVKAANPGMQPDVGGKTKPKSQGKMDRGTKADMMYRKANLKKEEYVDEADSLAAMQARREKRLAAQRKREGTTATGRDFGHDYSLTPAQQKARRDAEYKAGTKKEEVEVDEAMSSYDRNRKRAAQRAAARNAARDAGKTGVVPGVGYVTPRRERETYTDEKGTVRHKSGAKMEEVEAVDEALTGDRIKKAIKKPGGMAYTRKVSEDPAKRATRGGRGGESDFGAGDRGTGNKSRRRRGMPVGDED